MHNALLSSLLIVLRFRLGKLVCFGVHSSSSIKYTQDNLLIYIKYLTASNTLIVVFFSAFSC